MSQSQVWGAISPQPPPGDSTVNIKWSTFFIKKEENDKNLFLWTKSSWQLCCYHNTKWGELLGFVMFSYKTGLYIQAVGPSLWQLDKAASGNCVLLPWKASYVSHPIWRDECRRGTVHIGTVWYWIESECLAFFGACRASTKQVLALLLIIEVCTPPPYHRYCAVATLQKLVIEDIHAGIKSQSSQFLLCRTIISNICWLACELVLAVLSTKSQWWQMTGLIMFFMLPVSQIT